MPKPKKEKIYKKNVFLPVGKIAGKSRGSLKRYTPNIIA